MEEEQYHRQYRQHRIHGFSDSVAPRLIFFLVHIACSSCSSSSFASSPPSFFPAQPHKDGKQDGEQRTGKVGQRQRAGVLLHRDLHRCRRSLPAQPRRFRFQISFRLRLFRLRVDAGSRPPQALRNCRPARCTSVGSRTGPTRKNRSLRFWSASNTGVSHHMPHCRPVT